ncbi:hypothetical protein Tco_0787707 [Tanacetum coccineum]
MIVQAQEQVGKGLEIPTDSHHTPTNTQPSTSKPQKKQSRRKQRKDTKDPQLSSPIEPVTDDTENVASVPTHSNDPLLSGKDRMKLNELMNFGRKILDIDADEDITLDSTHVDTDNTHVDTDPDMFGVHDLYGDEVFVEIEEPVVNAATTTTTTIADEVVMNLDQTLIEIKSAKPKSKKIVMQEPSESTPTISYQQPSQVKGQGSKDKVALNLQAELEEEEKISRQNEEEANIALIESWDNTQAMMDADYQMA